MSKTQKVVVAKVNINRLSIKEGVSYPFIEKVDGKGLRVLNNKNEKVIIPYDKVKSQLIVSHQKPKHKTYQKPFSRKCEDAFRGFEWAGKKYTFTLLKHPTKNHIVRAYCRKSYCPAVISYKKAVDEKKIVLPGPTAIVLYAKEDHDLRIRACWKCKKFEVYRDSARISREIPKPEQHTLPDV